MDIIDNKAVRLYVKQPERVLEAVKKSKVIGEASPGVYEMVVHFGFKEMQALSQLSLKGVRSPIVRDYNWPGIYKPFDHQRTTAEFLSVTERAYCFNEQGLGKSGTVLWAYDYLKNIGQVKRMLVVAPVSIMYSAWVNDAFKTVMHRKIAVAHGTPKQRVEVINGEYDIVVINYDGIPIIKKELKALKNKFDIVVFDEANYVKNPSTQRWKAIHSIIEPETKIWMLTGTPAAQSPVDAFGLAKLCTPHTVPRALGAWKDKVMIRAGMFKTVPSPKAQELVFKALQPAIRFTKDECLDLPDRTYMDIDVPMTKQQEKYYNLLKKDMAAVAGGEKISVVHAASQVNKLLQVSCGAVYSDSGEVVKFDAASRLEAMMDVIDGSLTKTIVFVPFRHALNVVVDHIASKGYSVDAIFGGVSVSKRTKIFKAFQETPDPKVLVIQPQSASHGVTLTAASTTIWFGPTSSAETYLQANDRNHRAGQKHKTLVVRLSGSPAEKIAYKRMEGKVDDQTALMDLYNEIITGG